MTTQHSVPSSPLAVNVRRLREARSWSQDHLAEAAALTVRTVQRVEAGESASSETLLALAGALDTPADELRRDYDAERFAAEAAKYRDSYELVPLTLVEAVTHLHDAFAAGSYAYYVRASGVEDEVALDVFARLEQESADAGDIWGDVDAVGRREMAKSMMLIVEELRALDIVICIGVAPKMKFAPHPGAIGPVLVMLACPRAMPKKYAVVPRA